MRGRRATDLVTILLKKRLFSSPAAFGHTVGVYLQTLQRKAGSATPTDDVPEWMEDFFDDVATYDDESLRDAEDDAIDRAVPMQVEDATTPEKQAESLDAEICLLYTSPSPRDLSTTRMPSSA